MKWILIITVVLTIFCFYKARRRRYKKNMTYEESLKRAVDREQRACWQFFGVILLLVDISLFFYCII